MRIEIRLTERCNYNCWYCTDLHNNNSIDVKFDYIGFNNLLLQFDDIDIFIYGGEPTIYNDFEEFVQFLLGTKVQNIIIQTNGSQGFKKELFKNNRIKINYSYHKNKYTLKEFINNIKGTNINEIAYMDTNDDYNDFNILKTIFKDKIQFCPLINSSLDEKSSTISLKELEDKAIFKDIQEDWHFIKHATGKSNYDYWKDDSNEFKGKNCSIKYSVIHIQNNLVYFCFNSMIKNKEGISFDKYKHTYENITCPFDRCYFDISYIIGIKDD